MLSNFLITALKFVWKKSVIKFFSAKLAKITRHLKKLNFNRFAKKGFLRTFKKKNYPDLDLDIFSRNIREMFMFWETERYLMDTFIRLSDCL